MKTEPIGKIYKTSEQNGWVYWINGVSPCICVGAHGGVEPRIILIYEDDTDG